MSTIDEKALVQMAAKGNADAFEELVIAYQLQVYRLAFRITGNAEDAADLTQEALLKAWRGLPGFQFQSSFSTWLYRLTSNVCIDFMRSAKQIRTVPLTFEDANGEEQTLELRENAPTPEDTMILSEEQEALKQAFALLEPEHRQILTLRVLHELSYSSIAEILQVREGTVKSRLSRARESLRKNLLQIRNKAETKPSKTAGRRSQS